MATEEESDLMKHWICEYDGKQVAVQLKGVLYTVTAPGMFVPVGEGAQRELHKMPVIAGMAHVAEDQQGNFRLNVTTPDPMPGKGQLTTGLDPELIEGITVVVEEPRIVS